MSESRNALVSKTSGVRNSLVAKPLSPSLWERLLALFRGEQLPNEDPPEYMPIDSLPPDAQEIQRRKAQALRDAMRDE